MSLWESYGILLILCRKAKLGCLCTLNANLLCEFLRINLQEMSWQRPAKQIEEWNYYRLDKSLLKVLIRKFMSYLVITSFLSALKFRCIKYRTSTYYVNFLMYRKSIFLVCSMHFWFSIYVKPFIQLVWSIWQSIFVDGVLHIFVLNEFSIETFCATIENIERWWTEACQSSHKRKRKKECCENIWVNGLHSRCSKWSSGFEMHSCVVAAETWEFTNFIYFMNGMETQKNPNNSKNFHEIESEP